MIWHWLFLDCFMAMDQEELKAGWQKKLFFSENLFFHTLVRILLLDPVVYGMQNKHQDAIKYLKEAIETVERISKVSRDSQTKTLLKILKIEKKALEQVMFRNAARTAL